MRATNVVNATGVWADRLRPAELHDEAEVPVIRPSRGTHLIVPAATLPMAAGAIVPAGRGRTIFVLPWLGQTLIGTTDTDHEGGSTHDHVRPTRTTSRTCSTRSTRSSRPTAAGRSRGGLRGRAAADLAGDPKKSVDISRKAELYETSSGMITITGGKLTTWRRMAKKTVDRIVERDGSRAPVPHARDPARDAGRARGPARGRGRGRTPEQLAGRYGHTAHDVLRDGAPRGELAEPIVAGRPTCWPRSPTRSGASRRAPSATCCCGARGSG